MSRPEVPGVSPSEAPTYVKSQADVRTELMGESAGGAVDVNPAPEAPAGAPHYEVVSFLARGAMGEVHIARDVELKRRVALKQIGAELLSHAPLVGRFLREVLVTAQLDHPNVVPVYGLEKSGGGAVGYAMKLVEGRTLKEYLDETWTLVEKGTLDERHALETRLEHFLKVCDAVSYAHGKGVLHRDLKPVNLMLGPYHEVYVMDWGLARLIGGKDPGADVPGMALEGGDGPDVRTRIGSALGTPAYMSPEQAAGMNDELSAASDQYTLGLILFEIVTLERAIPGKTMEEVLQNAMRARSRPAPPARAGLPVPPELVAVVAKATKLAPAERYPSVTALADDVRRFLRGEAVSARPDSPFQKVARYMARHRARTLAAVLALLAVGAAVVALQAVRTEETVERARENERRLARLLAETAQRAERIETQYHTLEAFVTGLATAAADAMERPDPGSGTVYLVDDFRGKAAPPDLEHSKPHAVLVSKRFPVFCLPPEMSREEALPSIRRLASIQDFRERVFVESLLSVRDRASRRDEHNDGVDDDAPILWSMIGLSNGVASIYPGTPAIPEPYDPRTRPWYTAAQSSNGVKLSAPFWDHSSARIVVALSRAVRRAHGGELLGVVAIELTYEYAAVRLLARPEAAVRETFLLDTSGRVLVRSTRGTPELKETPGGVVAMGRFPIPSALDDVLGAPSGTVEDRWQGRRAIVAFYRLPVLGWTYVSVADADMLDATSD